MPSDVGTNILQFWSWSMILLSRSPWTFIDIAAIQLMENWRRVDDVVHKRVMLALSALALGGCGIWCTHFTGMTALKLEFEDGSALEMDFELGLTILSFVFAVLGVLVGLKIASMDPYFVEMEAARRKEMLAANLKNMKMSAVVNRNAVTRRIKIIALFSRLWLIMLGGAFAALGVLGMHYLGMMAQRMNAIMELNAGIVVLSVLIAFFTANAAFWILFRAVSDARGGLMHYSELLRLGSALIMGVAVCATHYCGMGAASYKPSAENFADTTRFIINRSEAAIVASHGALLTCYWLASFSVVRNSLPKNRETSNSSSEVKLDAAMSSEVEEISQHWLVSKIFLSYLIAITGSFCTIQLMEKWRSAIDTRDKFILMLLSSIALGGCGIWCMHFTGMNALELTREDGSVLTVDFEAGMTILSFICAVGGVFVGLWIASADPFFLELEQEKRKNILVKHLASTAMSDVVNKQKVAKRIKFIALFSHLPRIAGGGLFAALGVLVMHYLGMMAQRTHADMTLTAGIVVLSVLIAFFTATAAFWILFRALTFFQDSELLRLGSALIMGIAVCGTHYSGMGAASYTFNAEKMGDGGLVMKGSQAAILASHGSLLFCYWVMTWSVASSVRNIVSMNSNLSKVSKRDHGTGGARKIVVGQAKVAGSNIRTNGNGPKPSAPGPGVSESRQESVVDMDPKSSVSAFNEV
ncbi:hypothetical protein JG688_00008860 [Phytophthora aleatoria]|uniref:MHYT domain-containing protein n=1 Tax=Phytophthora aleatoria TaxID=2496075 RepID=A0A8J5J7G7_9STRA|nr:hypothetical protein JG688_00008860 [Phytophthora aleatoria]